ncbi:MAG: hypothetical protein FJX73_11015 [Armatimonadetes bacterium]|nr:hypothetical protein [Armatimonadota bacterium]
MTFEIRVRGQRQEVEAGDEILLEPTAGTECWRLVVGGRAVPVRVQEREGRLLVTIGADRVEVGVRRALPVPSRRASARNGVDRVEVRAPMPGLVVSIPATIGELVRAGGAVAVVEAMKMQMEVASPTAGCIEEIRVRPGQEVAGGQVLVLVRAPAPKAGEEALP